MNRFKFDALCNEFPFIQDSVMRRGNGNARDVKDCENIIIKRATREMLDTTPQEHSWDGSIVGIDEWERVDFILCDGTILNDAVKTGGESGSNYAHSETRSWQGETVAEAIFKHGVADSLAYVVWIEGGYNIVENYSTRDFRATIYKPSRDFTWQQVIDDELAKAIVHVRAEINF